jgi:hypothetical protein
MTGTSAIEETANNESRNGFGPMRRARQEKRAKEHREMEVGNLCGFA